jgi:hypothetical protein
MRSLSLELPRAQIKNIIQVFISVSKSVFRLAGINLNPVKYFEFHSHLPCSLCSASRKLIIKASVCFIHAQSAWRDAKYFECRDCRADDDELCMAALFEQPLCYFSN